MKAFALLLAVVPVLSFAAQSGLPPLPLGTDVPTSAAAAVVTPALSPLRSFGGSDVDLRFVPVAQVIDLIYADLLQAPYVISPDVLADVRPVSFRFSKRDGDVRPFLANFLRSLGYAVANRDGVDYVSKPDSDEKQGDQQTYVYAPHYRDADYLSRIIGPLFPGKVAENHTIAAPEGSKVTQAVPQNSAAALVDQSADVVVLIGSAKQIAMAKSLLPQLDTPVQNVSIRAWVYEVSESEDNNTAFQLAVSLLGGRIGGALNVGSISDTDNAVRLSVGGISAALSALNSDSRFKVLTSPNLRVRSGQSASLNVGEEVPVISSVSYPSSTAAPVQSVTYEDAGVIFKVEPVVKADTIDLHLDEEISNFVNTTTGVNNSPTKNTRQVQSDFSVADGDVLLIGGLTQDNDSTIRSGISFLPRWASGKTASKGKTEILLLLQVNKSI